MLIYILRRILWMVPTMFGITLLIFCLIQLAPGDPAAMATMGNMDEAGGAQAGADVQSSYEKFRERYHLDDPLIMQYGYWLWNVARLDFGNEFFRPSESVLDEVWRRLHVTVPLSLTAVLLSYLIALPLGMLSAVRRGTLTDKLITLLLFMLYSLPTFWVGLLLILAFGKTGLDALPIIGLHDPDASTFTTWEYVKDTLLHSILPVATLTYGGLAYLSRQMRAGMLETVRQDYIRTARAKGLAEHVVVLKHAARNSLIPVITIFASILPILIGGSVIVEVIFNIRGMGLYAFEGIVTRDYNIVMATTTFSAFMTLLGFLVSDILYAVVDPRIAYD